MGEDVQSKKTNKETNKETNKMMIPVVVLALLVLSTGADTEHESEYSFVSPRGRGGGASFILAGTGRITAIRVWQWSTSYLVGFQFRFGSVWSDLVGHQEGAVHEMELFDDEKIVQISGKYSSNIQSVVFFTNLGRSLSVGHPTGHSFNMYPTNRHAELRFISGRYHGAITSIGSHWAVLHPSSNSTMERYGI